MPIDYRNIADDEQDFGWENDFHSEEVGRARTPILSKLCNFIAGYWFLSLIASVCIVFFIGVYQFLGLNDLSQNLSEAEDEYTYQLGNQVLSVPMNYLRFSHQGQTSQLSKIELHALWPSFEGFSRDHIEAFSGTYKNKPVIRMRLYASHAALTGRQKLERIYALFFSGSVETGPSGLLYRGVKKDAPFEGEIFYYQHDYAPDNEEPFVVRCAQKPTGGDVRVCLRDIGIVGDLRLVYSFPKTVLDEWQQLDAGVLKLVRKFIRKN